MDPALCLQTVKAIPARSYVRSDLGESTEDAQRRLGVVAQEVAAALPPEWKNIVFSSTSGEGEEGEAETTLMAVDYSRLSVLLLGACQALSARVEALEAKQTTTRKRAA